MSWFGVIISISSIVTATECINHEGKACIIIVCTDNNSPGKWVNCKVRFLVLESCSPGNISIN